MGWLLALAISLAVAAPALAADAARIDAFKQRGWAQTDFTRLAVSLHEVISGGPPKDGIPSIDDPEFAPVGQIKDLVDREPVIGVEINGDARAYPLRILTWHEIVNDTVGGVPVAITYCPLCNAAIVFERTVDGQVLDFGTTGLLRRSDLVMYDRQTESWWQQFTGEAIVGAMTGATLTPVPARLEAFEMFKERHPDGEVLVPNDPNFRAYGENPYVGYDTTSVPFLYRGPLPEGIDPMARVVVYRVDGQPKAVAMALLADRGELIDGDVVVRWRAGQASALDSRRIADGRDVGNVTVERRTGSQVEALAYHVTFAFVVKAFHPDLAIAAK